MTDAPDPERRSGRDATEARSWLRGAAVELVVEVATALAGGAAGWLTLTLVRWLIGS